MALGVAWDFCSSTVLDHDKGVTQIIPASKHQQLLTLYWRQNPQVIKQDAHQMVGPGETRDTKLRRKSLQAVCTLVMAIWRQTVAELFDPIYVGWTCFMHFYSLHNYILQPTRSS